MSSATATCRCGHTRDHHLVSAEAVHTLFGWLCIVVGISATPTRVNYRCRRCDQVFDGTTDPAVLRVVY